MGLNRLFGRKSAATSRELPQRHKRLAAGLLWLFGGLAVARTSRVAIKIVLSRINFFTASLERPNLSAFRLIVLGDYVDSYHLVYEPLKPWRGAFE